MKGYSFRSLTDLVLKIFKTKVNAGTGLSGGGSLEADRTLSVKYGTTADTATQGNDSRLSNSREWIAATISQTETEVGTATTRRAFTAQRVRQNVVAWWSSITGVFGRDLITSASNTAARDKLGLFTSALRWPTWAEVTGKPTTFTPSDHTHPWSQVTGQPATATRWPSLAEVTGTPANYPTSWNNVAAKPAQATRWPSFAEVTDKPVVQTTGASTSAIMSQKATTDALNTKAALSHTHPWSQVTGQPATATRWPSLAEVTGKPANYPTTWDSVASKPAQATRWPNYSEVGGRPIYLTSPEYVLANKTINQWAHEMGRVPFRVDVVLRCKVADLGYAVGEEVSNFLILDNGGSAATAAPSATASHCNFPTGDSSVFVINKIATPAADFVSVVARNWRIVFKAVWV